MNINLSLSKSMEDYLETILTLIENKGTARVTDIADSLNIAASSVNEGIQKLSDNGLVTQKKYGPIKLTKKGKFAAEKVHCTHQILAIFFNEILGVDSEIAEKDACNMEHCLSNQSLTAIIEMLIEKNKLEEENCSLKFLREKETDNKMTKTEELMLDQIKVGTKAKVLKINSKGKLKRKLMDMGLNKGALIEVKGKAPMGDPIEVKVRGYSLSLRQDEAAEIKVEEV
jgi:DtxR family Mn-dependent transcriptional regulator